MELCFTAGNGTIRLVHDIMVCRARNNSLLRRFSSRETLSFIAAATEIIGLGRFDREFNISDGVIKFEVQEGDRIVIRLSILREGVRVVQLISSGELHALQLGLEERLGKEEYLRRVAELDHD